MARTRRAALALVLAVVIPSTMLLSAYDTYSGDHKLALGIYGRHYWFDGSIGSALESEIFSAKYLWNTSETPARMAWGETSTKTDAEIEFYQSGSVLPDCGYTYFYDQWRSDTLQPGL